MRKSQLTNLLDQKLLDSLYGWCYSRTSGSAEAQELCSDITFAIVKSANRAPDAEIENAFAFIWQTARRVYADFAEKKRLTSGRTYHGDADLAMANIADEGDDRTDEDDGEALSLILHRIAFLSRIYREVMIAFYLDGLPVAEIAKQQNTSEGAIRERLRAARGKIRDEVKEIMEMEEKNTKTMDKPTALRRIDLSLWGTGNPMWSDPRIELERQLSVHVLWLCRKKPRTPKEISDELGVPMMYVEEECERQVYGNNGEYGALRRVDGGKYVINFPLLDKDEFGRGCGVYGEVIPNAVEAIKAYVAEHESEYLAFPYKNRTVTLPLVMWRQVHHIGYLLGREVEKILDEKYFSDVEMPDRQFSIYGYEFTGNLTGWGNDTAHVKNFCGYRRVAISTIYHNPDIKPNFYCGYNIANDEALTLAVRAVDGIDVNSLGEDEREQAARAIEEGYIYRDGDKLYTKFLVVDSEDQSKLWDISDGLSAIIRPFAETIAEKTAKLLRSALMPHLYGEYRFANSLFSGFACDAVINALIDCGTLPPPNDGKLGEYAYIMVLDR